MTSVGDCSNLQVHGAKYLRPRRIVVGLVFRALPNSIGKDLVNAGGEVKRVPEYVLLRVLASRSGRVTLVAVLARRSRVCAKVTLPLTTFGTLRLRKNGQTRVFLLSLSFTPK